MLRRDTGIAEADTLVFLALRQLEARKLLEPMRMETGQVRHSRRQMLRQLGVATAAWPLVISLAAPRASAAASPPGCPPGQIICGATCIDPTTNNKYCGATAGCIGGVACTGGLTCVGGTCTGNCPTGEIFCSGTCINPLTNNQFCGAAGNCTGGNAGVMCTAGATCMGGICSGGIIR